MSEQGASWQKERITYFLRVEQGHKTVSRWNCSKQTRSHTCWEWNKATRGSAGGIAANRPDHILPEGGTRPQEGQQVGLQQTDQITYILKVEQGHKRVSRWDCSKQTRSHTDWGWNKATRGLVCHVKATAGHLQTEQDSHFAVQLQIHIMTALTS
jgi:hypothetical protein